MAEETEETGETELTNADWGKVHALAWQEENSQWRDRNEHSVSFRHLLETDPTWAIQSYAREENKKRKRFNVEKLRIVQLRPKPCDVPNEFLDDVNPFPPSCC